MRADVYLVQGGYAPSRTLAQKLIESRAVSIDGRVIGKSSEDIAEGDHKVVIEQTADTRYVGRGGLKMEAALAQFPLSVEGKTIADVGASTGGFTDCLLQNGAARVYAVDAGHGQLHSRLLVDPRVRCAEGVNARYLDPLTLREIEQSHPTPDPTFDGLVDGCVMDVSFISQTLILPALASVVREGGFVISLIKPQFELSGKALGKHGVVKREQDRRSAVHRVLASAAACGFDCCGCIESPIEGGDGNKEYLAYFSKK